MNRVQTLNFRKDGDTVKLDVTDTTGRVQFNGPTSDDKSILIWNSGSEEAFIEIGFSTVNASLTTSMPIPAGVLIPLQAPDRAGDYLAAICDTGQTTTLYITPGFGS